MLNAADVGPAVGEIWRKLCHPLEGFQGLVIVPELKIRVAQCIVVEPIKRIGVDSVLESLERFSFIPQTLVGKTQAPIAVVRVRSKLKRLLQFPHRFRALTGYGIDLSQRKVNFRKVAVYSLCTARGLQGLRRPGSI